MHYVSLSTALAVCIPALVTSPMHRLFTTTLLLTILLLVAGHIFTITSKETAGAYREIPFSTGTTDEGFVATCSSGRQALCADVRYATGNENWKKILSLLPPTFRSLLE